MKTENKFIAVQCDQAGEVCELVAISTMGAETAFSGRIIEIDYETSRLVVRYEGKPPSIGCNVIAVGLPVAYRHHYSDGFWRLNNGELVNGLHPDCSQPIYVELNDV